MARRRLVAPMCAQHRNVITDVLPDIDVVVAALPDSLVDSTEELRTRVELAYLTTFVDADAGDLEAAIVALRARASGQDVAAPFGARPRREDVRRPRRRRPSSGRNRPTRPRHRPCAAVRVRVDRGGARRATDRVPRRQRRGAAGDVGIRDGRTDPTRRGTGAVRRTRPVAAPMERDVDAGDRRGLPGDRAGAVGARRRGPSRGARRAPRRGLRRRACRGTVATALDALRPRSRCHLPAGRDPARRGRRPDAGCSRGSTTRTSTSWRAGSTT